MSTRLNKLLAERGIGARRKCDALIQSGVVRVNGAVVTEPGTQVEPERDRVEVSGRPLPPRARMAYYVLHKPVGVISTLSDPEGRRTLREFLPSGARVFPVGRLDADTSGLLLLTNDGELAHHLMHPRYGVVKCYRVHADRVPSPEMLRRLTEGIEIEPGVVSAPAEVRVRDETPGDSVIEIAIKEGRYRQVRRMCEAAGLSLHRLHRWAYGPLRLGDLERGMWRELSEEEVRRLRVAASRPRARGVHVPPRPAAARRGEAPRPGETRERAPRRFRGAEPERMPRRPRGEYASPPPRPARGTDAGRAPGRFRRASADRAPRPTRGEVAGRGPRPYRGADTERPPRPFRGADAGRPSGRFRGTRPERGPKGVRGPKPGRAQQRYRGAKPERAPQRFREAEPVRQRQRYRGAKPERAPRGVPPRRDDRAFGARAARPGAGPRRERGPAGAPAFRGGRRSARAGAPQPFERFRPRPERRSARAGQGRAESPPRRRDSTRGPRPGPRTSGWSGGPKPPRAGRGGAPPRRPRPRGQR